ncbi:MAG: hypothetical protein GF346_06555 [Candidatus Eisenbacteria bacterium]|nr:hypothetical protein [Candidatus Latescibacterota bacterium]MBD3302088.1 hypothetical protein [Candidatus Eisenbacteria bacterium]
MSSRSLDRPRTGSAWLLILGVVLLAALATGSARAETWLCPICQVERIEVPEGETSFTCPSCEISLTSEDLQIPVAYLSIRTRPTQVVWDLTPECGLFTDEGLMATPAEGNLWIPWSAVEYYIPRMRILRLTSGEEIAVPYARGPTCEDDDQPLILATVADSLGDWTREGRIETHPVEEYMKTIFIVARSPAALNEARDRFIEEVETGKHPRLPRTQPRTHRLAEPTPPAEVTGEPIEVVLQVRSSERGRILKVNRLKGSGRPEFDNAALMAAYRSAIYSGGEMGAGVPGSMIFRYTFGDTVGVEAEPADPPMWNEWIMPPLE